MAPPFDIDAYWTAIIQGHPPQSKTFLDAFLPILRRQSAIAMAKKATSRPHLGYVVFLACQEHWNQLSPVDPFPFDTNVIKKDPSRLGMSMEHNDHINSSLLQSPQDLVAFVGKTGQTPQMASPVPGQPSSTKKKRKSSKKKPTAPNSQRPAPRSKSGETEGSPANGNDSSVRADTSTPDSRDTKSAERSESAASAPRAGSARPQIRGFPEQSSKARASQDTQNESSGPEPEDEDEAPVFHTFGPSALADLDQWAVPVPSSENQYREAPKLPTCGPWEIPLPPPMDPKVHVVPYLEEVHVLLGGVRVQTTQLPPKLKVELSGMQRAATHLHPDGELLADLTAIRWKAYRMLLSWAEHLKSRACLPSKQPLDIASFLRNKFREEGNKARDQAVSRVEKGAAGGGVMFPGEEYQMPLIVSVRDAFHEDDGLDSASSTALNPSSHRKRRRDSKVVFADLEDGGCSTIPAGEGQKHKRAKHGNEVIVKQEELTVVEDLEV
ncbi:hypothetical protein ACHAQA_003261 [Verticillium albo-atrum]